MPDDKHSSQQQPKEEEEEDSYVWDTDSQLYVHHSSGFYHDPVAGWYYCSKDGRYYKHENGEYIPLECEEGTSVNPHVDDNSVGCSNEQRPSSWVEDALIELYLAGGQMTSANGDDDDDEEEEEELEEGEWIPEDDFDPQDEVVPMSEEEMWLAQYGQVTESTEKILPEIPSVDLWDWKLVCEDDVARLVGRLVRRSTNLHPSVVSSGKVLKTAPVCETRVNLVRVKTGQVYKLQNPSAKYVASLSVYDSLNPTKDWGFPDISTTWQNCNSKVKKRKAKKVKTKTDRKVIEKTREDEVNMVTYRDRAAERRNLHGGYGVGPGQKGTLIGLDEDEDACEEDAAAEALESSFGSGSYARKIMGNMGWKEGETLGKNAKGLVEPIQAVGNTGNVGLGYPQRRR